MLFLTVFVCLALSFACQAFVLPKFQHITHKQHHMSATAASVATPTFSLSSFDASRIEWFNKLKSTPGAEVLDVKEWQDEEWRTSEGGFMGRDFIHSKGASVRIIDYIKLPPKNADTTGLTEDYFPTLVGPAHFTSRSESHRGLCHGGSFCALMDDAMGWMGFCVTGQVKPWSGYTVQVNTALKKSVPVDSVLKMEAWVNRREGERKYWIGARLSDPNNPDCVYCDGEGLFLVSPEPKQT
jgi:acyl-coenzyme A thioesterase PaaI-like protein